LKKRCKNHCPQSSVLITPMKCVLSTLLLPLTIKKVSREKLTAKETVPGHGHSHNAQQPKANFKPDSCSKKKMTPSGEKTALRLAEEESVGSSRSGRRTESNVRTKSSWCRTLRTRRCGLRTLKCLQERRLVASPSVRIVEVAPCYNEQCLKPFRSNSRIRSYNRFTSTTGAT
jgi:hypothetical protein